ncbi:adenosine deaminase [Hypoxylon sp. NC1633]|nr:adenosine deaminase [Hypoxylon sp. NC1633]
MHLEGSLEPELLFELAAKNNVALPASADPAFASPDALHERYQLFQNLDHFLGYYYIGMSVLMAAHTSRGVELTAVMRSFKRAQAMALADLDMTTELVMCMLRNLPIPGASEMLAQARDAGYFADGTLAVIAIDSSELPFPPPMWKDLYDAAKELGIRRTIHAGEEGPSLYTMLTMCPLSNVKLNCIPSIGLFPLRRLLETGVRFRINSDDPAYFGGYILENYCALQEAFDLDVGDWESIAKGTIMGSWCSEARKAQLLAQVEDVANEWNPGRKYQVE